MNILKVILSFRSMSLVKTQKGYEILHDGKNVSGVIFSTESFAIDEFNWLAANERRLTAYE